MSEQDNTSMNECCINDEIHAENIFDKIQSQIDLLSEEKRMLIHLLKIKRVINDTTVALKYRYLVMEKKK